MTNINTFTSEKTHRPIHHEQDHGTRGQEDAHLIDRIEKRFSEPKIQKGLAKAAFKEIESFFVEPVVEDVVDDVIEDIAA